METRMKWKYLVSAVFSLFISLPLVFAAENPFSNFALADVFVRLFQGLYGFFQNDYIVYGVMTILIFMLLYAIIKAALSKVKVFDGQEKQAKIVALSLSAISSLGLFWYAAANGGIKEILTQYLTVFGIFGGIVIGAVVFMIIYFGLGHGDNKSWKWAMMATGIAFLFIGSIIAWPSAFGLGWALLLIGLIFMLIGEGKEHGWFGGGGSPSGSGGGSSPGGSGGKPGGSGGGSGDGEKKRPPHKPGDPEAFVRFRVEDEDGNGLEGAHIYMKSLSYKWKSYRGMGIGDRMITDNDGYYPPKNGTPLTIPAGSMEIKVVKKDYTWQASLFKRRAVANKSVFIFNAGETKDPLIFVFKKRQDEEFRPYIIKEEIKEDTDPTSGKEIWKIKGIIR